MAFPRMSRLLVFGLVLLGFPALACAQQQLELSFSEGRVTLHAQNVPASRILAEWSRLGGTQVLIGEGLSDRVVTLQFTNMLERLVLDVLLRDVAGYVVSRRVDALPGASSFGRILIVPTSSAPIEATSRAAQNPPPAPVAERIGVRLPPPPFVRERVLQPAASHASQEALDQQNDASPVWMPAFARPAAGSSAPSPEQERNIERDGR